MGWIDNLRQWFRSVGPQEDARNPKASSFMNIEAWKAARTIADAPPWLVFPNISEPEALFPASQGANEAYFDEWWAFWRPLSPQAKQSYLQDRGAPAIWANYLKPGGTEDDIQKALANIT
jgi:hypothetical protein